MLEDAGDDRGGPTAAPPEADVGPELTPAQADTLRRLRAGPDERPRFPADLRDRLRRDLEAELSGPATAVPDGETLWVSKHALSGVHGCEARWVAEEEGPFVARGPMVVGAVAHKAIELTLNRATGPDPDPAELVDRALERLAGSERWMGDWLDGCDPDDRAEVRSAAVAKVSAFGELWPPLARSWRPVTEASIRTDLLGQRVRLSGKVDLTLGQAQGLTARKVIVDLKTGRPSPAHRDDLRFYALVETLRVGTPPRAVASSYLDSGELHVEAVTEDHLHAAVARTVDGAERMVALRFEGDDAARRPSGACRWCPISDDCGPGRAFLADPEA